MSTQTRIPDSDEGSTSMGLFNDTEQDKEDIFTVACSYTVCHNGFPIVKCIGISSRQSHQLNTGAVKADLTSRFFYIRILAENPEL
ncbi:hypothetical protein PXT12_003946 [Salmonella enterica]|nr:hypothetical protein [Salmonella enterica]